MWLGGREGRCRLGRTLTAGVGTLTFVLSQRGLMGKFSGQCDLTSVKNEIIVKTKWTYNKLPI